MDIRFNGGRGALLCDKCRIIVMEDFRGYENDALKLLQANAVEWFCEECKPDAEFQKAQALKFVEAVNKIEELKKK